MLTGGDGNDIFVFHKGEANGDTIIDFFGRGNADGNSIVLVGYGAGTTFTRVGRQQQYLSNQRQRFDRDGHDLRHRPGARIDFEIVTAYDFSLSDGKGDGHCDRP